MVSRGAAKTVWPGFFLFGVLGGFAPSIAAREGEAVAAPCRGAAAKLAMAKGDAAAAVRCQTRAFDCWRKISPLGEIAGGSIAAYGLARYQRAADIYDGCGHEGRGGWSWYTGAAARMLSAAYEILGLRMERGRLRLPVDLFVPKGELVVHSVAVNGKTFTKETALGTFDLGSFNLGSFDLGAVGRV